MQENARTTRPLKWPAMAKYGAGDLGLNFYWQGVGFFLLYFYTDIVGLPNTTAGIVYAIGGFVDALSDPVMGVIADRTRSRWGRYRPYLIFGVGPLGLSFIFLFTLPSLAPVAWVAGVCIATHILFRLCYTVVSIPYGALGTRLTFDARERTSVAGVRMLSGALGGVVIVMLVSHLRSAMSDQNAFMWISIFAAIIGAALICVAFFGTVERRLSGVDSSLPTLRQYSFVDILKSTARNTPFLIITTALFLLTLANMVVVKTILYRFDHILASPNAGSLTIILMAATPLIAIPIWVKAYHWLDKRAGFLSGCAIVCLGLLSLYTTGNQSILFAMLSYITIAAGFSAFAVGVWSIIPDTIDFGHWKSGYRVESALVGFASAIQKAAIAIAGLCVGVALDAFGYHAGEMQDAATLKALHDFSAWVPIGFMFCAAAVFNFYPITALKHARIMSVISRTTEKKSKLK